jgi:copper transporter 1
MEHDHGAMAMTTTASAAGASATGMSHGGGGGMGGGSGCKISVSCPGSNLLIRHGLENADHPQMLWNWNTIDSCFLASSWKITSTSVFAGSCIGVVLLVISLEMLRRAVKEFDRYLINKHIKSQVTSVTPSGGSPKKVSEDGSPPPTCVTVAGGYRPTILEQAIRALLHMLQFAVAYFVMLYGCTAPVRPTCRATLTTSQASHVLQWLHHYLHLSRCLHRQFHLPLGAARRVSVHLHLVINLKGVPL